MERLLQDLGYAWRHLRRSPGFALAAILTLALGIGANTAMFSMLNALTLRKLPVEKPDELVGIAPRTSRGLLRSTPISAVAELQRDGPLQHLCGYLGAVFLPVLINNSPVQTMTTFVTGQCFAALGVTPIMGRAIEDADAPIYSPGARVAVVSHRLWTHALGSNPAVLGTSIQVNNVDVTIIGVLPREFVGLDVDHGVDVFTPFDAVIAAGPNRRQLASFLLGRLRPRVTLEEASAELQTRWPALLEAIVPATLAPSERTQLLDSTPHLERMATGTSRNRERYVRPLMLTLGITALLLFLACINLGGLLLARLAARSGELAVRLALGGSRWRIGQQMLIESLVLSLSGAALGVPVAYAIVVALVSFIPPQTVPYTMSFTPDARALAVTGAIGVAVGIGMTALPIWMATRRAAGMQAIWQRTIAGSTSHLGRALLVAQVSLSVVSLTGAALLTRSLHLLQNADLGIPTGNILNVKLSMRSNAPYNRGDRESYYPPLLDEIAALPSVRAVSIAHNFPRVTTTPTGLPVMTTADQPSGIGTSIDDVSPGFFATMGIPLLAGRDVSWATRCRHVA